LPASRHIPSPKGPFFPRLTLSPACPGRAEPFPWFLFDTTAP
jgi:hypothetical protein